MIEIFISLKDPTAADIRHDAERLMAFADALFREGRAPQAPHVHAPTPAREPQTCIACGTKSEGVYEGDACLCCGLTVNEINESSAVADAEAEAIRATEEFVLANQSGCEPQKEEIFHGFAVPAIPFAEFSAAPPAPPVPPVAALAPAAVQLDKAGLPWDRRIHADAENKLAATGLWKRRRGVTDDLVAEVEAELRGVMAVPTPPPAPPAPNTAPMPDGGVANTVTGEYTPPAEAPTLADFMRAVTPLLTAKTLIQADIITALQGLGLANVLQLNQRPDLIPALCAALGVQL